MKLDQVNLYFFGKGAAQMSQETINRLFEKQVEQTPDNIALIYEHEKMTYAELNREANKRAHYLREKGVGREQYVGIVMDHCLEMIINIFAVLKSGAAYIPMEPTFPKERINYIICQAGIEHLFTQKKYKDIFKDTSKLIMEDGCFDGYSNQNIESANNSSNAIYVLFTSGTTGAPKGVVVEQRNVCNYVQAFKKEFHITDQDKTVK